MSLPIPDLRFEQTFLKQIHAYSKNPRRPVEKMTDSEIRKLNREIDVMEENEVASPLPIVTPYAVIKAVLKDHMMMPFVQGLLWSGFLILARPMLGVVARGGFKFGVLVSTLLGVSRSGVRV